MKLVMLRATHKQTVVEYQGQKAINDDFYEDVKTSSDYWTVWANELLTRGWYDEVELWYQEDKDHKAGVFKHSSGLKEVFWPRGYEGISSVVLDVLFVRGNVPDYNPVLQALDCFKVYYPSGPYYCPNPKYNWGLCFVEDPRHIEKVRKETSAPVELFKKSCVGKFFLDRCQKKFDICFVCCAPIYKRKRLFFLKDILTVLKPHNISALVIGLKDKDIAEKFEGLPVTFTGWIPRTEINKAMCGCKIGIVLSDMKQDGCPRAIQEFLAGGLPILVSDRTCCSSIYLNMKTGLSAADIDMPDAVLDLLAITPFLDANEFYRTSLSIGCSAQHFRQHLLSHGGPIK